MEKAERSRPSVEPTDPGGPAPARRRSWIARALHWVGRALVRVGQFLMIAWGTLAIYYSNLPWAWGRMALALAFGALGVWALWVTRRPGRRWVFAGALCAVAIWWACIPPSHDRPWRRDVAVLPRAIIDGDRVRLTGVRNFIYRSEDDFDERY